MAGRRINWYLVTLALIFAVVWTWSAIEPIYPHDWLLENYLVFIFVPVIIGLGFYFRLSNISYTLITIFMCLHVIGSHYTYAEVPFGFDLQEMLSGSRNYYDRLVHFSFGFLLAYPVMEVYIRVSHAKGFWAYYLPVELTLAFSAIFELFEWGVVEMVNSEAGIAYLGAQGDIWDAQKDMALAGLGAFIAMFITMLIAFKINPETVREFRQSFKIDKDDRPIGEIQLKEWWQRKKLKELHRLKKMRRK
ncbi:MAG: DUF2238 domain-containing protein [Deltaproteobacteria bacterium]|nr:MAG: DUF2238 domain-containing protein [Deltaproteobacteria bacterium]